MNVDANNNNKKLTNSKTHQKDYRTMTKWNLSLGYNDGSIYTYQ